MALMIDWFRREVESALERNPFQEETQWMGF
jgi:hypothetical protein